MADDKSTTPVEGAPAVEDTPAPAPAPEVSKDETTAAPETKDDEAAKDAAPAEEKQASEETAEAPAKDDTEEKPAETADADTEMKDAEPAKADATEDAGVESPPPAVEAAAAPAADDAANTPAKAASAARRKSVGPTLKKKGSKARILHLEAKPGDYYFVKLKGSSPWPAIIADEEMLTPEALKRRPVSAAREDGTYREDFADGGKRVYERRYPVMYLCTNDFQWVVNTDLTELDVEAIKEVKTDKMKKDLRRAYELAIEHHDLDYYKQELKEFEVTQREQEEAEEARRQEAEAAAAEKAAKAAAKAQATPAKKSTSKKSKAKVGEDEDVDMPDAEEEEEVPTAKKSSKKRKAEGTAETPQRTESVKKPKIKLVPSSTPKTNGTTSTPKTSSKATESKSAKSKSKNTDAPAEKEMSVPKEPEYTPEERHARKEKEVLFLRHKLQKGLLTRDQEPKEEEMKTMSDYIAKLEHLPDLEVSIIRATKINKVLKAILKMDNIPKESEFKFKSRSQALLDQWNKILAQDEPSNGVNGTAKQTNGTSDVKEKTETSPEVEKPEAAKPETDKDADKETETKDGDKEAPKDTEKSDVATPSVDEKPATTEEAQESESVAATA